MDAPAIQASKSQQWEVLGWLGGSIAPMPLTPAMIHPRVSLSEAMMAKPHERYLEERILEATVDARIPANFGR